MSEGFIPLTPIPIKERSAILFLEYGQVDVVDGAFGLSRPEWRSSANPGGQSCVPDAGAGIRISHAAVSLAARVGCLLVWVGEAGVRLYAAGQPGGARADRLLYQARCALDETARINVVREMYRLRFQEDAPSRRSVDQLRGIEGARVKQLYKTIAAQFGVIFERRRYDPAHWESADIPNRCLSAATACLYGLSEAAILAAGYAPAIGFLHRGKPQSFVYDVADIYKFDTVVPVAFQVAARISGGQADGIAPERQVRIACRDAFRRANLLERLIPSIAEILAASGLDPPQVAPEGQAPALPTQVSGDAGHRG